MILHNKTQYHKTLRLKTIQNSQRHSQNLLQACEAAGVVGWAASGRVQ